MKALVLRMVLVSTFLVLCLPSEGLPRGGVLLRELAEQALRKGGKEVTQEGIEKMAGRLGRIATQHGDDAARAAARLGPRGVTLLEEAGELAPQAARLMVRHEDRAIWIIADKNRLALFARLGDDAAESMLKHGQIVEPLLVRHGQPAAAAFKNVSSQNARRLAMMAQDGELERIGRTPELMNVIARYGDRAADFVWRNKGALAVGAALAAFLANPEAFLNGVADITKVAAEAVGTPLATAATQVAGTVARHFPWTTLAILIGFLVVSLIAITYVWARIRSVCLRWWNRCRRWVGRTTA